MALAAPPVPNFPRLRALALFGRRLVELAERLKVAGVQKPAQQETHAPQQTEFYLLHLDLFRSDLDAVGWSFRIIALL